MPIVYKWVWHHYCRWCSLSYETSKRADRDGFCCPAHKQALYRARKNYITRKKAGK